MKKLSYLAALVCAAILTAPAQAGGTKKSKIFMDETFQSLDGARWSTTLPGPGSSVEVRQNEVRLANRAYLFSRGKVKAKDGYKVHLEWTWEDTGGKRPYADTFVLCLRTTGALADKRAWETMDGLRVRLNAGYGFVQLEQVVDGKTTKLGRKDVAIENDKEKPAWPEGAGTNWYAVDVKDDGETVTVFFQGKEVLKEKYDRRLLKGRKVGFGNRENVGGFDHVSYVRKIEIKPLKKRKK